MPLCPGGWLTCDEWMTLSMWKQKWSNYCMSRRADVVDIVSIDQYFILFSFQTHNGSCIILLSTEEGHVTSSDQRNMGRSSNCPFLVEAEKKPVEKYPVSSLLPQRPVKGTAVHLGSGLVTVPSCLGLNKPAEQNNTPLLWKALRFEGFVTTAKFKATLTSAMTIPQNFYKT